jgi:hypothetical protein
MKDPRFFTPYALMRAHIVRESRLLRDLTMPRSDWSAFDAPSYERLGKKAKHFLRDAAPSNVCSLLVRQA